MRRTVCLLLLQAHISVLFAQVPEQHLKKVQENYTPEKIYIHFDKENYAAGEVIWFKAYLVESFLPSSKSTVLSVEMLNDSGGVVAKKILPVSGSAAVGDISLDPEMPDGNYMIRAYTRELMNFGYDHFYYHQVYVFNPKVAGKTQLPKAEKTLVNFFPESGNLIAGVNNNVAFKVTDNYGRPMDCVGTVTNASNKQVASFRSEHDGMGSFELTPVKNESYFAECKTGNEIKKVPLPSISPEGIAMKIFTEANKTYFKIDASTAVMAEMLPSYLVGVQENIVVFKVPLLSSQKIMQAEIPVNQLLSGILQVTVFNRNNKPLAERLVFINSGDYLPKGEFKTTQVNLKRRGKNSFSYTLADTTAGTFSVSVTTLTDRSRNEDIISRFLLTSELKGWISQPSYYFESNDEIHQRHLDLVMLTHGWRRYSWDQILSERFPLMKLKDTRFISMDARALSSSGKPLINTDLTVISKTKDGATDFLSVSTDSSGALKLRNMLFEDTAKLIFKMKEKQNKNINIALLTPNISGLFQSMKTPLPEFLTPRDYEGEKVRMQATYGNEPLAKFDGIVLDEIKLKARIQSEREKYESKYVSGRLGSSAVKTLDFMADPPKFNMRIFEYLQSRLTGVNISGGPIDYSIVYRNTRSMRGGPIQMTVYLDEFQVSPDQIAMMSISDIAMVQVFSNSAMTGTGGALAIYTRKGDAIIPPTGANAPVVMIEGFSPTKEFYSPDYESTSSDEIKSDNRTTLFWNPYLITNSENQSIKFSFFNSDNATKFKIILEGMMEDGKLLHIEKVIE